ncbi:MAG: A24 family peptidase [Legionellales bacterium]|jgi:leader peptidase (prepilin peptidase)/N-methyltransferase
MEFIIVVFVGLVIGSFLNVVIYRLPRSLNVALPASHCPKCKTPLRYWQNIPIISFFILKGRCHTCKAPISYRYVFIEILTMVLSMVALMQFGWQLLLLPVLLFTYALIALTFIDIDEQILPDSITLSLLWIGLALNSFNVLATPLEAIWGAIIGFSALWLINYLYSLFRKRDGIGMGDQKLLAAIGAWLGASALAPVIMIASLLGLLIALILMMLKRLDYNAPIPFGPFLALAAWGYLIC